MNEVHGGLRARKRKVFIIVGSIVLALCAAVGGFFAWRHYDSGRTNHDTVAQIISEVGALYELPANEQPTIAELQNPTSLQGQEFYQKAQKGDYVLIYPESKLAIIYRASAKKLINVDHVELEKP